MDDHIVLGIHVSNRVEQAVELQKIFTEYGCNIKTRVGLHDTDSNSCSPTGVILLEVFGDDTIASDMLAKFNAITGVEAQKMVFSH